MAALGEAGSEPISLGGKYPEGDRIERYRKSPAAPGPDFG